MIHETVKANRSCRRFQQDRPVDGALLRELVDLARLSPSAANLQPLKYVLSSGAASNAKVFPTLAWAGYLSDWDGPEEGERPAAYIVIVGDTGIAASFGCDHGIAAQSILLGAAEKGLRGCMIGSVDRERLAASLGLPEQYRILLVLALGYPAETIVLEDARVGNIRYWRDSEGVHHVPKRPLEEIIIPAGG